MSGKLVTPGLIDVHGHYFPHVTHMGISADSVCLPNGVTTTMDAGSSGWVQFDAFKEFILRREKTRPVALVNLSSLGRLQQHRDGGCVPSFSAAVPPPGVSQEPVGELMDLRYAQVDEAVRCIRDNPNVTLGVKVWIDPGVMYDSLVTRVFSGWFCGVRAVRREGFGCSGRGLCCGR